MKNAAPSLLALLLASAGPAAAAPPMYPVQTESHAVLLHIAEGNCPRQVTVTTRTRGYEGGAELTFRALAENFILPPVKAKRAAGRVDFTAPIAPPFQTCVARASLQSGGTAYAFDWRDGTWKFTLRPSRELQVMKVSSPGNNPTVVAAVAD